MSRTAAVGDALRRWAPSARQALDRVAPAATAPVLLYALWTGALFVFFLLITMPYDAIVRRAIGDGGPVTLELRDVRSALPLGLVLGALEVRPRGDGDAATWLAADDVRLAPSWLGLVRGHPWPLQVDARLYGGSITGHVDPRPGELVLHARFEDLDLARYGGLAGLVEGALSGRIGGSVDLAGDQRKPTTLNGALNLTATGLALEHGKIRGITVPPLHFPSVRVAGTVDGGRLQFRELLADGQEVVIRGSGHALLREPPASSLVSLELVLTPTAAAPDNLKVALNLIPGKKVDGGGRELRLSGTLGQLRVR